MCLSFFLIFISNNVNAKYFSADLKEAINIECKKSVKEKKYSTKSECERSLKTALETQGVVNVQQVSNKDDQDHIDKFPPWPWAH